MEYIIGVITLLIAFVALYFQIKYSNRKIAKFTGRINNDCTDKNTGKFVSFIFNRINQIIFLDIFFNTDEDYEVDENNKFCFHFYADAKTKFVVYNFEINVEKEDDFFYDSRPSARRLVGHFKIIGTSGPQQGNFTALLKPARVEFIK